MRAYFSHSHLCSVMGSVNNLHVLATKMWFSLLNERGGDAFRFLRSKFSQIISLAIYLLQWENTKAKKFIKVQVWRLNVSLKLLETDFRSNLVSTMDSCLKSLKKKTHTLMRFGIVPIVCTQVDPATDDCSIGICSYSGNCVEVSGENRCECDNGKSLKI